MIKLSEYLDVFIENLLKSRLFDFLLLNSIIFREDYQSISSLKYLNKNQVFFLCFISYVRKVPRVRVSYSESEFDSDIFSVYEQIDSKIDSPELQSDLREKAEIFYKEYINDISEFFRKNISNPVNIDLLALNNMIFSDKSYTVSTLQILGKGLGVTDYAVDRLQTDFPKFVEFVEFMKINISEL